MARILTLVAVGALVLSACTRNLEQGDLPVRDGPQVQDPSSGFRDVAPGESFGDPVPAASGDPDSVTLGEDLVG